VAVIGTAGHVDHGKSTLIATLTGRDPDRWAEEKARGLTIDLGFAWTTIGDTEISFVDVPGHERFIKNMLAGSEMIDAVLFVVAADEGWMPQSEEHLAVVDLLGVTTGVIALTKIDAVDDDLAELAQLEIEEHLANTALSRMKVVPVSATTGVGLDQLKSELERVASVSDANRSYDDEPKLWIDRSFSVSGAGTVVTGTLSAGILNVGDSVELWPSGNVARVRTLHRHDQEKERVRAGSRCAVNLSGVDRSEVGRGSLLTSPGNVRPTSVFIAKVDAARYVEDLTAKGAYHLHLGTGSWPVQIRAIGDKSTLNGATLLKVDQPLPVTVGERFILREVGRRSVVGGGTVVVPGADPRPSQYQDNTQRAQALTELSPDEIATELLSMLGTANTADLRVWSNGGQPLEAITAGDIAMTQSYGDAIATQINSLVRQFHIDNPLREGYPKASLASKLDADVAVVDTVLGASPDLRDGGATVALATFNAKLTLFQEERWDLVRQQLVESGLTVPRLADLGVDKEMLHVLIREARLTRVSDDFVYLPEQLTEIIDRVSQLPAAFTVAGFRDALGLSRKYAVPMLEYLDSQGVTVRSGDTRSLRPTIKTI